MSNFQGSTAELLHDTFFYTPPLSRHRDSIFCLPTTPNQSLSWMLEHSLPFSAILYRFLCCVLHVFMPQSILLYIHATVFHNETSTKKCNEGSHNCKGDSRDYDKLAGSGGKLAKHEEGIQGQWQTLGYIIIRMTSLGSKALITIVYTPMVVAMIHSLNVKLGKNPVEHKV